MTAVLKTRIPVVSESAIEIAELRSQVMGLSNDLADAKRLGAPMAKVVLAHSPGSKCARAWLDKFPA